MSIVPNILLPVGLAVVLLLCGITPARADEAAQAKSRLERLTEELGQAVGTLRKQLFERDNLRERLAEADRQVAQVNARLRQTQAEVNAVEQRLRELRTQQEAAQADIERRRHTLARSLALAARGGAGDRLKLLLKQQDPTVLARHLRYQRYLAQAQVTRLETLQAQLDRFAERELQIAADADTLAQRQQDLERQQQQLAARREERKALLARAEEQVNRGEQRVQALEKDRRELNALLRDIARRAAREREREQERQRARRDKTPADGAKLGPLVSAEPTPTLSGQRFSALRRRLPWPISGRLKANYGSSRASGRTRWDGVVIDAKPGASVRSIHAGKVVYADVLGGYGLLVIVDHGEGYMSLYGYNDAVLKRPGQRVRGGEVIATVGDRGDASGVYFEIRHRGKPVNPAAWCGS
ncbi:murein hydrolase activator EnvC [Immundisolibacter sp.]|uniref:murein hydrolase activator EnvC family protein n=1 Tax=Immundisolibacter sp. TaxID=1934948 RepID=UPI0035639F32